MSPSTHATLVFLILTTTIDASRLFYLPLAKIHPSHPSSPPLQVEEDSAKQHDTKSASSGPIVRSSAIANGKIDKQEEIKKRDTFNWEALLRKQAAARRLTDFDDVLLPASLQHFEALSSFDQNSQKSAEPSAVALEEDKDANEQWPIDNAVARAKRLQSSDSLVNHELRNRRNDVFFLIIVGTCCLVGVVGLVAAAIFWHQVRKRAATADDAEYPSYGVTGPSSGGTKISPSSTMSDRKLAQSAQMFHYQQQRQHMMDQEKAHLDVKPANSDDSDDESPGGGDYTVYECPGLAHTGEMEVRNPLFAEPDSSTTTSTSTTPSATNNHYPQPSALSSSPPKERSLP